MRDYAQTTAIFGLVVIGSILAVGAIVLACNGRTQPSGYSEGMVGCITAVAAFLVPRTRNGQPAQ